MDVDDLTKAYELLERIGQASPFVFTLMLLALSFTANIILAKLHIKVWQRAGDFKAVIIGLYVQGGMSIAEARKQLKKITEGNE